MTIDATSPRRTFLQLSAAAIIPAAAPTAPAPGWSLLPAREPGIGGSSGGDDTDALQRAIDAAVGRGAGLALPEGTFRTTGLTVPIGAGNLGSRFHLTGAGRRATRLVKLGTSGDPVLRVVANAIPTEAHVDIADLAIDGTDRRVDGIQLTGIAQSSLARVVLENCNRGLACAGSLLLVIDASVLHRSIVGAQFRRSGAVRANAITIRDSFINLNSRFGIDYGDGAMLRLRDCQLEANGTADNLATGALVLRSTLSEETGFAVVIVDGCWFEANKGRSIQVESAGGLFLTVRDSKILSSEGGRALVARGIAQLRLENVLAPSPGDTFDVGEVPLTMLGGIVHQLRGARRDAVIQNAIVGAP